MLRNNIFFVVTMSLGFCASAQEDGKALFEGNALYFSGQIPQSSAKYARALEANPGNRKANFNLGASLYKNAELVRTGKLQLPNQKMPADSMANLIYDKAADNFALVTNSISDKDTLHMAWHNMGNCYLQKKDFGKAVEAYKKALKFDPKDEETRYNLAYALKHMPPKKSGGGGGSQQQQKQQQNEDQKKPQPQQAQMSKEQADKMLKAMGEAEKKLQEKRKQKPEDPSNHQVEKDW